MIATMLTPAPREIGGVARELGVSCQLVRKWEREGKIPPPLRTARGCRLYSPEDVARMRAVLQANRKRRPQRGEMTR